MTIKKSKDTVTPALARMRREMEKISGEVFDFFVKTTPKRSGNARRSTTIKGNVIHANYPYAQRLDEGHSKQAPRGMVEPTEKFIERRLKQILRK
jgi:hypothetical protein